MLEKFKFLKKLKLKRKPEVKKSLPAGWGGKPSIEKPGKKVSGDVFTGLKHGRNNKIRIPGLKTFNQILLVVLLIMNFFISQAALISATPSMFFLFFANSYGIFYGLWKSRSQREKLVPT